MDRAPAFRARVSSEGGENLRYLTQAQGSVPPSEKRRVWGRTIKRSGGRRKGLTVPRNTNRQSLSLRDPGPEKWVVHHRCHGHLGGGLSQPYLTPPLTFEKGVCLGLRIPLPLLGSLEATVAPGTTTSPWRKRVIASRSLCPAPAEPARPTPGRPAARRHLPPSEAFAGGRRPPPSERGRKSAGGSRARRPLDQSRLAGRGRVGRGTPKGRDARSLLEPTADGPSRGARGCKGAGGPARRPERLLSRPRALGGWRGP